MKNQPVHILLVDDLEENLLSLEALLRRDELVLLRAKSGVEALEILLEYDVALALLDVQMPGMDGFELAELMRGTERSRRVPIIFLTAGSTDLGRRFRGYEAGAVDFLFKPIETDVLRSKVDVFVELYRQREILAAQRDAQEEANAKVREYARALQDGNQRKDEFLATLAHELRNPLAPIRNGLQIMALAPDAPVAPELREMMGRQMAHMVRLIDDLLDVSRISQGKITLRREVMPIQTAITAALEASRPLIEGAGHTLSMNVPEAPLWVDADPTRMAQIITNLLNNAAKYTPAGGRITLEVTESAGQAVIRVRDTGIGIPADMLPRVFDMFTQVKAGEEQAQGGLGIGLALVRQLLDLHGGQITAESGGTGAGSVFTVRLGLAPAPSSDDGNAGEAQAARSLRVLVVDDNVDSAKTSGWMLEMMGHEYQLAHSGPEAIEAAPAMKPDVILMDIGMPGMNGYEACRILRADPAFKDTVFIAQTGWGQDRDRQQARDAGFDHHVVKPVPIDALEALLARV